MPLIERIALPSVAYGQRELIAYRYGGRGVRPVLYCQAALHADELPGVLILHHLMARLAKAEATGELLGSAIVLPCANPIGLDQWLAGRPMGRFDLESGINFNRRFPNLLPRALRLLRRGVAKEPYSATQQVRQALITAAAEWPTWRPVERLKAELLKLAFEADYVLDLHCDSEALVHLYAASHQQSRAQQLARAMAAEVLLLEEDPGGWPFDHTITQTWRSLSRELGQPLQEAFAATLEWRGQKDVDQALAEADAQGLWRFLWQCGVVAETAPPPAAPPQRLYQTPLAGVDVLTAPTAGLVVYQRRLGEMVRCGDVIAHILAPSCTEGEGETRSVCSQTDGLFFARNAHCWARPGQAIGKVAGANPLPHRRVGALLDD